MAQTVAELRALSDEELIELHDRGIEHVNLGTRDYQTELARRDADRRERTMIRLTWAMLVLTIANVVLVTVTIIAG